ncbi:hypothetical protein PS1M3_04090 [Pseudoalteromonas sp. PS1M3]|uniref:lipopolysaccharide biosynthesis protein n=1 Tax=Pseudoalteromonas sp. PS1M3 TaxID=87791 RepID=UPI001950BD98|nr:oligosaccharide flippase family protein [Pseudoalteromonas sp. PS1M3]BBW90322.1 hypothetical protein PS1M3_04090 [Pseudoalteromonas sp. PS1M3]
MESKNKKNIVFVLSSVLVNAITLFIIYKYALTEFGSELASIWALVMSISGAAKLADFGLASAMPKFISESISKDNTRDIKQVIATAFFSVLFFGLIIACLIFTAFYFLADRLFNIEQLNIANTLILYGLPSFVITAVANSLLLSLDGWGDGHYRAKVTMLGVVVYALFALVLGQSIGIEGLVLAHLLQGLFVFVASSVYIFKKINSYFFVLNLFSIKHFKSMFKVSMNLQLISILSLFGDNLVKILIGHYAEIRFVVFYEMASKLVSQVRMLAISGCQLLVPIISKKIADGNESNDIVIKTFNYLLPVNIIIFSGMYSASPLISMLWIGEVNSIFIYTFLLLSICMMANIPIAPLYFANLADGNVFSNLKGQLIISLVNICLAFVLGYYFSYYGVVGSYAISVFLGSFYLGLDYKKRNQCQLIFLNKFLPMLAIFIYPFIHISFFYKEHGWFDLMLPIATYCFILSLFSVYCVYSKDYLILKK